MSPRLELATGRATTFPRVVSGAVSQVLRPAIPDDAPRLVAMFERCSPASRYARFLAPLQHFPAAHLTDVVCSSPIRRSWVVEDVATGDVVAVASWVRNQGTCGDHGAEVGLLVEDAFQHLGLGTALLDELATSARHEGITTFVAHTLADARHVHRMLRHLGPVCIEGNGTTRSLHVALTGEVEALAG